MAPIGFDSGRGAGGGMRSLAFSAAPINLAPLAPPPAPVPTYGVPVPVAPPSPVYQSAQFNPWGVSGQLPVPPVPQGRPPMVNTGPELPYLLSTLQMGLMSRLADPRQNDLSRYLPGLFGGGRPGGIVVQDAPAAPKVAGFDPQRWTDY